MPSGTRGNYRFRFNPTKMYSVMYAARECWNIQPSTAISILQQWTGEKYSEDDYVLGKTLNTAGRIVFLASYAVNNMQLFVNEMRDVDERNK